MVSTSLMVDTSSHPRAQLHRCVERSAYDNPNAYDRAVLALSWRPRLNRLRQLGRPVMALARAATLVPRHWLHGSPRSRCKRVSLAPAPCCADCQPTPLRRRAPRRPDEAGQIARLLELKPGMTVGDIGAGSGYHTVRLSHLVGPAGSVVAQDVTRDYLIELARRTELLKLTNVKFALGEPHDPRLPASSLDAAILVHMYHEIAQPYAFLYNLAPALKPGARVGIVDLELPTSKHGTPIELLRCELAAVGYRAVVTYKLAGDGGYLAVFSPPEVAGRRSPRDIIACGDRAVTR
jgi:protein-L-isoaspartate O-methyltransferase